MFTQEQILEIKQRLRETSAKDTEFPLASLPLEGDEIITVVQGGENKKFPLNLFFESFSQYIDGSERVDFFNVSRYVQITQGYPEVARLTLPEAVESCPEDVRRPGQVITFMDNNDDWATWQFIGVTNETWGDVNTAWKNLDESETMEPVFTCTPNSIDSNIDTEVLLHFESGDGEIVGQVDLYANDELLRTYTGVSSFNYSYLASDETDFKVVVLQYGHTIEKIAHLNITYNVWIGSGNQVSDVLTPENLIRVTGTLDNTYEVTFNETAYFYIVVPSDVIVSPVTMNGLEVPMESPTEREIEGHSYTVYRSSNKYIEGTHTFVIGTYQGNDTSTIATMQTDLGGLQTLMGEQQQTNIEQTNEINGTKERVSELEKQGGTTADEEDITVVDKKYKLANKVFSTDAFSGYGRNYLRKFITEVEDRIDEHTVIRRTVNLLMGNVFNSIKTAYVIQYDYTLHNETITLPEDVVLLFIGGSISDGTIVGSNTKVVNLIGNTIFTNVTQEGTWAPTVEGNFESLEETITNLGTAINNLPTTDEEDLTTTNNKYKLANKAYNATNFSGLGKVYLRKNIMNVEDPDTGDVYRRNLLTQEMVSQANTIYVVQYDFDLNAGETNSITLPSNCVLLFLGGTISNGTIVCDNTTIVNTLVFGNIFNDVTLSGQYSIGAFSEVAFSGSYEDLSNKPTNVSSFTNDKGYISGELDSTRPSLGADDAGYVFFDTENHLPIWWDGAHWYDFAGNLIE